MKKILIPITLVITVLMIWKLASNKREMNAKKQVSQQQQAAIPVQALKVTQKNMEVEIKKTGNIIPFQVSKVASEVSGKIEQIYFNLGDTVQVGQSLGLIEDDEIQLKLRQAKIKALKAKEDLQTYTELLAENATTAQKVKDLKQNYEDTDNQVKQLQKQTSEARPKADISGIIADKNIEKGDFVSPGSPITTIVNIQKVKVQVYMSEQEVYQIHRDEAVVITTAIYTLNNKKEYSLRAGTFVNIVLKTEAYKNKLMIPRQAIVKNGTKDMVFVVNDNRAVQVVVKTGMQLDDEVEIIEGLQAGQRIVTSGQINLQDGSKISITQQNQ